ncbi:mobile mystery protein B [Mesorhizobium sp. Cs1299R1N1]|uniref:mobile mystery protein B n=2 Tax=Mesorhizobium TaxID=68287 RepID=UPI00301E443B
MTVTPDYPVGATPLDPNELGGLRHKHITTQAELDELEQSNIASGLLWLSRTRRKDILTHGFAVELHRRLFGEVWHWAGAFRTTGKNIGVDPVQIGVQLREALDDALYWADRGTYVPVEAAVRLHHRIVFIHPFANGNGRHARILADAMLEKVYGVDPIDWADGADLLKMNERRAAYISALKAADRHDISPLLAFAGLAAKP